MKRKFLAVTAIALALLMSCTQYVFVPVEDIGGNGGGGGSSQTGEVVPADAVAEFAFATVVDALASGTAIDGITPRTAGSSNGDIALLAVGPITIVADIDGYTTAHYTYAGTISVEFTVTGEAIDSFTADLNLTATLIGTSATASMTGTDVPGTIAATVVNGVIGEVITSAMLGMGSTSVITVGNESVQANGTTGEGTRNNPYTFTTAEQLVAFSRAVNDGSLDTAGKYFALGADVNLADVDWEPIGYDSTPWNAPVVDDQKQETAFQGDFNGNGNTIKNMTITLDRDKLGFFGSLYNANVHNLKFENASVSTTKAHSGILAGTAAGDFLGHMTISDIEVSGKVSSNTYYAGGIVGGSWRTAFTRAINNASVSGEQAIGGISGFAQQCTFDYCKNTASISGTQGYGIGGIVGHIAGQEDTVGDEESFVRNCTNSGAITATYTSSAIDAVGGIVGMVGTEGGAENNGKYVSATISNCNGENGSVTINDVSHPEKLILGAKYNHPGHDPETYVHVTMENNNPSN